MDHPAETKTVSQRKDPRTTVIELLRSRNKQARFMTELQASLARYGIGTEEADRALAELESERVVMIRIWPASTCASSRWWRASMAAIRR